MKSLGRPRMNKESSFPSSASTLQNAPSFASLCELVLRRVLEPAWAR